MFFFIKYYFTKFFDLGKKVFLVLATFFVVISIFIYFINKDKPKQTINLVEKNRQEIYKVINDKHLNSTKEGKIAIALYRASLCGLIGEACTDNPKDGDKNFNQSLFGFITNLIVLPYANPPASGVYWAYSSLQNAGFIPKTYAAEGIGFAAIKPFMNLWKVFRDISYMILVLVLITIGFMIMFRMKLNPQTVISVESALPKIVISLLLITFSFPIAGFLIDLMYVSILIVVAVLSNKGNFFPTAEFQNTYLNANFGTIWSGVFANNFFGSTFGLASSIVGILPYAINQILRIALATILGIFIIRKTTFEFAKNIVDWILTAFKSTATETITIPIVVFGIFLKILFFVLSFIIGYGSLTFVVFILTIGTFILTIFRIFFLLLNSYIKIFLMIIFSPLFMLFEAIPSGKSAFSYWFKSLFTELLTFPLIVCFLLVSYIIINVFPSSGQIWRPPFLVAINPNMFTVLLGFGIIFMIPDLVKLVKQMLGAKDLPISIGIGTYFAGAGAVVGGGMGIAQKVPSLTAFLPNRAREFLRGSNIPFKDVLIPPTHKELQQETGKAAGEATAKAISAEIKKLADLLKEAKQNS